MGCAGAFDERAREATRSIARLLTAAGADFAVLGPAERCTGDPARRMGHEYLFQMLAEQNVATLKEHRVTTIVASCAHCFNTLANEYPDYGGTLRGRCTTPRCSRPCCARDASPLARAPRVDSATFHDACYLGRHNGRFDAPREVLGASASEHGGDAAFAASARSAAAPVAPASGWRRTRAPIASTRRASPKPPRRAPTTVATACPYCLVMLDDASKSETSEVRVADVATLLAESVLDREGVSHRPMPQVNARRPVSRPPITRVWISSVPS